jgi:hypothetical protein
VQTNPKDQETLDPSDWNANPADGTYNYPTDMAVLRGCTKLTSNMNIVILPKSDIGVNGIRVDFDRAAVFLENFLDGSKQDIESLTVTCAHEVGHLLRISTRNIPRRPLRNGRGYDEGEQHDAGNDNADWKNGDGDVFPCYEWTIDTSQLIINDRVASPGWYAGAASDARQDPIHGYDAAISGNMRQGNTRYHQEWSVMHPGGGGDRKWLRHEDWEVANRKAQFFE